MITIFNQDGDIIGDFVMIRNCNGYIYGTPAHQGDEEILGYYRDLIQAEFVMNKLRGLWNNRTIFTMPKDDSVILNVVQP